MSRKMEEVMEMEMEKNDLKTECWAGTEGVVVDATVDGGGDGDGDGEGSSRSAGVASCSSSSFRDEHLSKGTSAFLETVGVLSSLKSSFWQSAETFISSFNSFRPLSIFSLFPRSTNLFSSSTLSGLAVSALSVFESSRFASSPKDDRASLEVILCSFFFSTLSPPPGLPVL